MKEYPRVGSREWHARFEREQRNFDRIWPWWMALSIVTAITVIVLIATGVLPVWVLFIR